MLAARKYKVRIREGCTVYIDGVAYSAGDVVSVPAADKKQLLEQGHAEKA